MKVLMLNVNAISGSTGKIVTDIKNVLESQGHECRICYGANDNINRNGYIRICSEIERRINAAISKISGVRHGLFTPFSFYRFKKIVKEWNPDIVHLHCPNGYIIDIFKTLTFLAQSNIKTVITNHAEFFYTGGCGHAFECKKWQTGCYNCSQLQSKIGLDVAKFEWTQFKKTFDLFEEGNLIVTSVSPWVLKRSIQSPALGRFRNFTVLNGINTEIFRIKPISDRLATKLPKRKPIALHVSAEFTNEKTSIKGGFWIRELAKKLPEINFVVACTFKGLIVDLPSNVYIWGRTSNQEELSELYNIADVTILTSKRETFSMIVAESLCCGTPVVGFKAGGPESIAISDYTSFVQYGDLDGLSIKLQENLKRNKKHEIKDNVFLPIQLYSKESMSTTYLELYKKLMNIDKN